LDQGDERAFTRDPAVRKLKLHLAAPYDNSPAPPSPNVDLIVEADRLDLAIAEVAFLSARAARKFFQSRVFQQPGEARTVFPFTRSPREGATAKRNSRFFLLKSPAIAGRPR
jgi:hypothetical protein